MLSLYVGISVLTEVLIFDLSNVRIEVLGKQYSAEEFTLELVPKEDLEAISKWEIGGITDPLGQLINWLWEQIKNAFEWLYNSLTSFFKGLIDSLQGWISSALNTLYRSISDFFNWLWSNIQGLIDGLRSWIGNAISAAVSLLQSAIDTLQSWISSAIQGIADTLSSIAAQIASGFQSLFQQLQGWLQGIIQGIYDALTGVANNIVSALTGAINAISSIISDLTSRIQQLAAQLPNILGQISSIVSMLASQIMAAIQSALSQFASMLSGIVSTIQQTLSNIASSIASLLSQAVSTITSAVQQLWSWLGNAFTSLAQSIQQAFNTVVNTLQTWFNSLVATIQQALTGLGSSIMNAFTGLVNTLQSWFTSLVSTMQQALSNVVSAIQSAIAAVQGILQGLAQQLSSILGQLSTMMTTALTSIQQFFGDIFQKIKAGIDGVAQTLTGFINAILKFPEWFPKWFYDNIAKPIVDAITKFGETLGSYIVEGLKTIGEVTITALEKAWEGLQWLGSKIWEGLQWLGGIIIQGFTALGEWVVKGLQGIGQAIWNALTGFGRWFYDTFVRPIITFLDNVAKAIFNVYGMSSPPIPFAMVLEHLQPAYMMYFIGNATVALGDAIGDTDIELKAIGTGGKIRLGFGKIIKMLNFKDLIIAIVHGFITGFSMAYWTGAVMEPTRILALKSTRPYAIDIDKALVAYRRGIIDEQRLDGILAAHGVNALDIDIAKEVAFEYPREEHIREAFFRQIIDLEKAKDLLVKAGFKKDFVDLIVRTWYRIPEINVTRELFYKKLVGVEEAKTILGKLGFMETDASKILESWYEIPGPELLREAFYKQTIDLEKAKNILSLLGYKQEYIDIMTKTWFELPDKSDVKEMMFRELVSIDDVKSILKMYGLKQDYIDKIIETWYKLPSESDIKDAFLRGLISIEDVKAWLKKHGLKEDWLNIAMANWWKLASESDLRLMIGKHTVVSPEGEVSIEETILNSTKEILKAAGYHPDLVPEALKDFYNKLVESKVYEMAVYPSISDLISFMIKDVFPHLKQQYEQIMSSIRELGAEPFLKLAKLKGLSEYWALAYWEAHWRLIPPEHLADLYFWGFIPSRSFETYMRYHDFRPIPRVGMPETITTPWGESVKASDIWLQALSLYEIPLRIDVRWMIRWGITSPFHNVTNVTEELARIMQERRVRPDWAPAIFTAEWVNNLIDERNRLITALIKNMDEGFIDFNEFEQVVSKYEIKALPDTIRYRGITGQELTLKVPKTIWLLNPDEIELNKLRVKYDIKRYTNRMALDALEMEYVAGYITDEELEQKLNEIIVNKEVRDRWLFKIKARKIRDQLYYTHRQLLRTIDALCALYEEGVMTREQVIDEIKRVAGRYLTNQQIEIIVKESDYRIKRSIIRYKIKSIIAKLRRGAILPEQALEELKRLGIREDLAQAIVEAEGKVYTLSLSTLLSYIEYVPEAKQLLPKKLKALGIPEDEAEIVKKVAEVRPLRDEIRRIVSKIIDAYEEGVISDQELQQSLQALKPYGYTDDEIKLLLELAKLMRKIKEYKEQRKEYVPTPTMLASMAEYVPRAREMLKEVLEKKRVPREWHDLWVDYVRVRPVYDEVRRYVTELISDYVDGIIDKSTLQRELEALKVWGLDEYEINFLLELAEKRRMRKLAREARKR